MQAHGSCLCATACCSSLVVASHHDSDIDAAADAAEHIADVVVVEVVEMEPKLPEVHPTATRLLTRTRMTTLQKQMMGTKMKMKMMNWRSVEG